MNTVQAIKIASYASYREAMTGVEYITDARIPPSKVAVIADDLAFTGNQVKPFDLTRVLEGGLVKGAIIGAIGGVVLGAMQVQDPILWAAILGVIGAAIGAGVLSLLSGLVCAVMGMGRGKRRPLGELASAKYHIFVEPDEARKAYSMLEGIGMRGMNSTPSTSWNR